MVATKRELMVNDAATTLNDAGGINNTDTSVTVTDGSVFPANGNFRCLIDSEIVYVTARATNVLTIQRGIESTIAVSHTDGATITAIVTAASLKQYLQECAPYLPGTTPTKVQNDSGTILTSSSFTWDNQGGATVVDDSYGGITIKAPDNVSAHSLRMLHKAPPSAPHRIRALICAGPGIEFSTNGTRFGLAFRESDTGKIFAVEFQPPEHDSTFGQIRCMQYTNSTTLGSEIAIESSISDRLWLEIENDNTDIFFRVSVDDDTWFEIHTEAKGTYMASAGPDQVGFYINPYDAFASTGTVEAWLHLMAWDEE